MRDLSKREKKGNTWLYSKHIIGDTIPYKFHTVNEIPNDDLHVLI